MTEVPDLLRENITREFLENVSLGNIPGHALLHKFALNPIVIMGAFRFLDSIGTRALPPHVSVPKAVRVKAGGDVNDTLLGTGAQKVICEGIVFDGTRKLVSIDTNGADASAATTELFWRVDRAFIAPSSVGVYGGSNVGGILLEYSDGSEDLIQIDAGKGQSQYGAYTLAGDTYGMILSAVFTVESNQTADFRIALREGANETVNFDPVLNSREWLGIEGIFAFKPESPTNLIKPWTDLWATAEGGANTRVTLDFDMLLINEKFVVTT